MPARRGAGPAGVRGAWLALCCAVEALSGSLGACRSAWDCKLNGDCISGRCACDPAWRGESNCGVMSFGPMEKQPGKAPGYYNASQASWGGNLVKGDDANYHLFHAQLENHCGLYSSPGGWTNNSFIARSKSVTGRPEGPYQFVGQVVPAFGHNPEVHRDPTDGTYVVFFIGGWATTPGQCNSSQTSQLADTRPPPPPMCTANNWPKSCGADMPGDRTAAGRNNCCGQCKFGYNCGCGIATASSKSLDGPWAVQPLDILDQWRSDEVYCSHTNPTVAILPNGTWVMAFNAGMCNLHVGEAIGTAVSHGGWRGPWRLLSQNAVLRNPDGSPHGCEDPYIWYSQRGWHLLTHNYAGPQGVSSYAYSEDGLTWQLSNSTPYGWELHYSDGTSANLTKCERPKLIWSDDGKTPLFLANGARSADPAGGPRGATWTMFRPLMTQ